MDNSVGGRRPCSQIFITLGINNFHYNSSIKDFAFSRSAMKRWWFFDLICRLNFSDRTVLSLRWVFKLMLTKFYFQPNRNWALNLKTGLLCITLKIIWHSSQNKAPKQNLILTSGRKSRTWTQHQTYIRPCPKFMSDADSNKIWISDPDTDSDMRAHPSLASVI